MNQVPQNQNKPPLPPRNGTLSRFLADATGQPVKGIAPGTPSPLPVVSTAPAPTHPIVRNGSVPDVQPVSKEPASLLDEEVTTETQVPESSNASEKQETVTESDPSDAITDDMTDEQIEALAKSEKIATDYKNLAKSHRKYKQEHKAVLKEFEEAKKTLDKYKTGQIQPEKLSELQGEVARLQRLESVLDLETHPEYLESIVTPLDNNKKELKEYAAKYKIPEHLIDSLMKMDEVDKNQFISEHFDRVGGEKVERILANIQGLTLKQQEAKANSVTALDDLKTQRMNRDKIEANKALEHNQVVVENSWMAIVNDIKDKNKFPELIYREGDTEFNQSVVEPIHAIASKDYGGLVREIIEGCGAKRITERAAKAIARMFLMAHGGANVAMARNSAVETVNEVLKATHERAPIIRPNYGRGSGAPAQQPQGPYKPESLADRVKGGIRK